MGNTSCRKENFELKTIRVYAHVVTEIAIAFFHYLILRQLDVLVIANKKRQHSNLSQSMHSDKDSFPDNIAKDQRAEKGK